MALKLRVFQAACKGNSNYLQDSTMINTLKNIVSVTAPILLFAASAASQVNTQSSATGPKGNTATRRATRTKNSVDATVTGPNGGTATREKTYTRSGASSTVTGPKGNTGTRTVTRGGGSATATVTGPGGKSATRHRTTTVNK
jgi:hypothetical protein